jgi:hypothetical protein
MVWRLDLGAPEEVRKWLRFDDPQEGAGDDDWDFRDDS